MAVDRETNALPTGSTHCPFSRLSARHRLKGVARFAPEDIGFALFHCEEKLINRVIQFEEREVRLQTKPQARGWRVKKVVRRDLRPLGVVEGNDLRPLEARHIERQFFVRRNPRRFITQESFESLAKIAQGE